MWKKLAILFILPFICGSALATNVEIVTNKGVIQVELDAAAAPQTVENFLRYVDDGFYNGTIFHRVISGFMIQGGGFTKDLERKPTRRAIPYEGDNERYNDRGTIAMARTQDPNSATSQFFINHVSNPFLNHRGAGAFGYTVFGKITQGMDVIDAIAAIPTKTVGPYRDVPSETIVIETISRIQ